MKYAILYLIFGLLACSAPASQEKGPPEEMDRKEAILSTATAFFATYAERADWDHLLSYYREDMVFEDVILQINLDSLWQFERFYNWPDTNFQKLSPEQPSLVVEQLTANDSVAIASGYFTPFYWQGKLIEPDWGMQFQMILYFDKGLKIKRQVDWIEYDDFTLESVIKRYREVGVDEPPAWLDLEK